MTDETRNYRHSVTGQLQRLTEDQASVFGDYLEPVADDAKPYAPGLFKPGKVGEFKNPEPKTDRVLDAERAVESLLTENAPNSKIVREAKAELAEAEKEAEEARLAAEKDHEAAEAERVRLEQEAAEAAAAQTLAADGDQAGQSGNQPTTGSEK